LRDRHSRQLTANQIIVALNSLYGCPGASSAPKSAAQAEAQRTILKAAAHQPAPRPLYHHREAAHELLQTSPSYDQEAAPCNVAPYRRELLSIPAVGSSPPDALKVLDPAGAAVLSSFEDSMMLGPAAWGEVVESAVPLRPYMIGSSAPTRRPTCCSSATSSGPG